MEQRCETCRHWKAEGEADDLEGFRLCDSPKVRFATTRRPAPGADAVLLDESTDTPIPIDGAGVLDGSGYWGALVTGAKFGCVQHEPATSTPPAPTPTPPRPR
jgi:hypothetical protein